ncbi:PIG-L deacetylase family protein [Streptomyces sp. NPDC102441]|uniref:PIG-L deacetylase family protein n=1 Tax=Streptomyces sp. NPDC102441 TaxID=3366176 RepID=UPI00382597A1
MSEPRGSAGGMANDRREAAEAIQAAGTDESLWAAWGGWDRWGEVAVPEGPVVVLAAHPDDEVLGFGGTIGRLTAADKQVHVVTVTDGEGSHPGSRQMPPPVLARARRAELADALDVLGVDGHRRHRLGVADTGVDKDEADVGARVEKVLRNSGATLCVAPWSGDLHSDHEAVGRAARAAATAVGIELWQYPVWMWHWAVPEDPRVPWRSFHRLPLAPEELARKGAALRCFRTQIAPLVDHASVVLPPEELAHHQRPFETVIVETESA